MKKKVFEKAIRIWQRREQVYTVFIVCGSVLTVVLMYFRAFYGTELTDEAYYVSEAKEMLNGNIPFSYNNSSKALGFTFLLIAIEALYRVFMPDLEGVFLFTRLCFVTYKVIIWFVTFRIFQRKIKKAHALLASNMLLLIFGYLQNFSYNTVPILTMFLAGSLLYDTIEQDAVYKKQKLIIAGGATGIACFANPGWAVSWIIFSTIIWIRIPKKQEKIKAVLYFEGAVLAEILIVVIPIVIQTGFSEFWYGFYRLFLNPIPMDSLNPDKTWRTAIASFMGPCKVWFMIFCSIFILTYIFSSKYIHERGMKLSKNECLTLSTAVPMFIHLIYLSYVAKGLPATYLFPFVAVCYMLIFLLIGTYKGEKIIWYLGIYPLFYIVATIIMLSNGANIVRFENCPTVLIVIIYVLMKDKSKFVRLFSNLIAVVSILTLGYAGFHEVYRDSNFGDLNYKVESGVYKGIYTTAARARDLPELEEYLNNLIGENETYAFRDNVPSAYLMVHTGRVCEISTWDILQHTYHRNSPAVLFDYYRRRDMIPDKIIYVDYGRDENLSITESEYRYNDWVNRYYDLIEDIELNETFFHVMVYQYNGTFDGNYQYWIDTYWELVK